MGCFNLSGFFSHIPMIEGDRIGAIVCLVNNGPGFSKGCPIGATGHGFHPIMAPFYGEYNDYGGIENIDENYSTKRFKEIVGIDVLEFIEKNYRNTDCALSTPDNDNPFDDIPTYQKYLAKIVPLPSYITIRDDDESVRQQIADMNDYFNNRYKNMTVHIIYEHESILKSLIESWPDDFCNWNFERYASVVKRANNWKELDDEVRKEREKAGRSAADIDNNLESVSRYEFSECFSLGDCNNSEADLAILYCQDMSDECKEDVITTLKLAHGLERRGGFFVDSKYAGQETEYEDDLKLHEAMVDLIKEKIERREEWRRECEEEENNS